MSAQRIGQLELAQLRQQLTPRDRAIVTQVAELRLMSARQIEALHFFASDHVSQASAARASRRVLERLTRDRLLVRLKRRVGGVYAGSAGYVYALGPIGQRLLELEEPRPRLWEPSRLFVEHTLAIAQLVADLTLRARSGMFELLEVQAEPQCWRRVPTMERSILRPDLFLAIGAGEVELRWFVEIDRSTVHLPTLLKKCRLYDSYYRSGAEQATCGVFPRVLWIISPARGEALRRAIDKNSRLTERLFVITTEEAALEVIAGGAA